MITSQSIAIPNYNGNLELINQISSLINTSYSNLFHAVIVHGSVASDEVIKYSDFDGLLIVKDEYVNTAELKKFKKDSLRLILNFDPLQHHGWFQIGESQLKDYPEHYLPLVILKNAKLIFIEDGINSIDVILPSETNYKLSLIKMIQQFENRLETGWKPKNLFQLKSVLSQIMLMPSLYYSAINSKGILKKDSFGAVKMNFNEKEWMPIDIASQIRLDWNYNLNAFQAFLLRIPHTKIRKIARLFFSPKINPEFKVLLSSEFYSNLELLIKKIKSDIQ